MYSGCFGFGGSCCVTATFLGCLGWVAARDAEGHTTQHPPRFPGVVGI